MDITYNINQPHALNLGQQYDHNLLSVTFTGFVPKDENNTVYLKYEGLGLYPLFNMGFTVSQAFTLKDGVFKGQLVEVNSNDTLVQNSTLFNMMVKPSIDEQQEIVSDGSNLDLWFTEMSELYNTVSTQLANGDLVGDSAYDIAVKHGYVGTEQEWNDANQLTSENIASVLGYTPANAEDIPNVHEWALADTKPAYTYLEVGALSSDTFIPTKVSDLENDSGYINDVSNLATTDSLDNAVTGLAGDISDLEEALRTAISQGDSDLDSTKLDKPTGGSAGQILTKTVDGASWVDPDGNYTLLNSFTLSSDIWSVVRTKDSDDNAYNLKAIAVFVSNSNGINAGANAYAYAYDSNNNVIGEMPVYFYASSSAIKSVFSFEIRGAIVEMQSIGWTNATYSPTNKSLIGEMGSAGNIAKIEINGNGVSFKSGTRFKIYGVNA